ncbi:MFS transporter [Modestobacter roseus]|nr:MFS transporter [Modestobacter roseus]
MGAFREPRFRRLFVGWSLGNFGDSALYLTLGIWAKELTGSNAAAGLVFLAILLPTVAAPAIGHLADRVRRRPLLITVDLAAGLGVLSLLTVRGPDQLWLLYAVAFGYGLVATVHTAAQSGLVRDLLPDELLPSANGALSTVDQGLRLVSPLVGAGLYAAFGGGAVAVLTASTFAVAAVLLGTVRIIESDPAAVAREPFRREFTAGFRHLAGDPVLRQIVLALAAGMSVLGLLDTVVFAVIDEGLGRPAAFFGVLTSVQGGGSVVGGLTAAWLLRRVGEVRAVGVSLAAFAVALTPMAFGSTALVLAGAALAGASIPWFVVAYVTARQKRTPRHLQGRVAGAGIVAMNGAQTVSSGLGAVLIGLVDHRLLIAVAVAVLAVTGARLVLRPRSAGQPVPQPGQQPVDVGVVAVGGQAHPQPTGVAQPQVAAGLERVEGAGGGVDAPLGQVPVGVPGVPVGEGQQQGGGAPGRA